MFSNNSKTILIFEKIRELCDSASEALKNVKGNSHQHKVRLACNANEFCVCLQGAITSVNYVIPHVVDEGHRSKLLLVKETLFNVFSNIQKSMFENVDILKEKLISTLKEVKNVVDALEHLVQANDLFIHSQVRRVTDELINSIYKLLYAALLFEKSSNELQPEFVKIFALVLSDSRKISQDISLSKDEFSNELAYFITTHARVIPQLENWVEINHSNPKTSTVGGLSAMLCDFIVRMDKMLNTNTTATYKKSELEFIFEEGLKKVQEPLEINDSLGGEEFIRGALLHAIAISYWYNAHLNIILKATKA